MGRHSRDDVADERAGDAGGRGVQGDGVELRVAVGVENGSRVDDEEARVVMSELKAVEPPRDPTAAVPPFVPVVWSQATKAILASPRKLVLGTKRIRVLASAAGSAVGVSSGSDESPVHAIIDRVFPGAVGNVGESVNGDAL